MKQDEKNIDKLFRQGLDNFEEDLPDFVWDNIENELDKSKRKRLFIIIRSFAASVAIMLAFVSGYFLTDWSNSPKYQNADIIETKKNINKNDTFLRNDTQNDSLYNNAHNINIIQKNVNSDNYVVEFESTNIEINTKENKTETINNSTNVAEEKIAIKDKIKKEYSQYAYNSNIINNNQNVDNTNKSEFKNQIKSDNYLANNINNQDIVESNIVSDSGNSDKVNVGDTIMKDSFNQFLSPKFISDILLADKVNKKSLIIRLPDLNQLKSMPYNSEEILIADNSSSKSSSGWTVGGQFSPIVDYDVNFGLVSSDAESSFMANSEDFYSPSKEDLNDNEMSGDALISYQDGSNIVESPYSPTPNQSNKVSDSRAYTGGVKVKYQTKKRWGFQSGLYYSKRGRTTENLAIDEQYDGTLSSYSVNLKNSNFKFDMAINEAINNSNINKVRNYASQNSINSVSFKNYTDLDLKQKFEYIEIPLMVQYKIIDRKLDVNILGGISTNILIANTAWVDQDNKQYWNGKTEDISAINYSASMGMGIEYNISDKFSINIEPTIKYMFNHSEKSPLGYPYTFAVFSGVNYKF